MSDVHNYMVLTAQAPYRDRLAADLITAVEKRRCEVVDCRITPLGPQVSASLLLRGNWSALGKLESALPAIAEPLQLQYHVVHTDTPPAADDYRPYAAELVAPQQATLLGDLLSFFAARNVHVVELGCQAYASGHTGAPLCNVNLALQVPLDEHPQALREAFMDVCDDLHADGILDPVKS